MKPRKRKCKICKEWIDNPRSTLQVACGIKCAIAYNNLKKQKKERENDRKTRERLKSRSQWLKETQSIFNKYIRTRDKGLPCISCGKHHPGQNHAGHYYSTAARPDLRFGNKLAEINTNLQCQPCNTHLSGNIHGYRDGLLRKYGEKELERLEKVGRSDWSIEELKEIKDIYKKKIKLLGD